ncbi:MAG: DUF3135 domain-containing protein [Desulfuromonadales bacterium]|nr:DUF3135 domain-containing protein [Desulfuromonadales bacterium]
MENPPRTTDEMLSRLTELYQSDPEAFEAMRQLLIDKTIEGFPPEHRIRAYGLQRRIDTELSRYKDPIARMNRMVEIFWEGVYHFQEVVSDPQKVLRQRGEQTPAKVIPFRRKSLH